jgi:hypothetical protein
MKVTDSMAFPENVGYRSGRLLGHPRFALSESEKAEMLTSGGEAGAC